MDGATLPRQRAGQMRLARLRAVPGATWARLGFAALCAGALFGYFAFPTYPTYDSFYALLWGRDLLHLHLPDFSVYRGPTEHPLAIAFGTLCSVFGQTGARLMVLGSIASFVALTAGAYRLARLCFGPLVALLTALLVLTRLFDANLAAQGYLDITYIALIVWATALEVERPRRGTPVFALLLAAGLLRPDAWVLGGVYWLWCAWPVLAGAARKGTGRSGSCRDDRLQARRPSPGRLLGYLVLVGTAPVLWVAFDGLVTGDPLYSLHSTAVLAAELERTQGFTSVLAATWRYLVRIDKLPIVLGGLAGVLLAAWLTPRRARVPLAVLGLLLFVYVAEGAAGASVIDRYMLGAAALLLPFCALAIGGWSLLREGSLLRRVWMFAGAALLLYGAVAAVTVTSLSNARTTLAYHDDFHEGLAAALHAPAVRAQLARCPLLSLPDNKLIPDARWILDTTGQRHIVARSQARAEANNGG
ncbi:MAG: hypothetical protein ACHQE6_10705, partial [Solirubrobacterales bacterium]